MRLEKDVLVLGGSGLIGEPTVRAFQAAGARVAVLSRGDRPLPAGAEALLADRRDVDALSRVLEGRRFDLTIDLLAYDATDVERLLLVPHVVLGRLVAISSGQVYLVTESPEPPFREEDARRPLAPEPEPGSRAHANWVYGMGKRRMESALRKLRRSHGVRALALRLPIILGAGDRSGRLWAYVERIQDGGPLLVPGALEQPLRFVWAEDVARVLVAIATQHADLGPALNWAQPDIMTFASFVETLADALGARPPSLVLCTSADLAGAGLDEAVSPYVSRWCSVPDPARAVERLGLSATPFPEALPRILEGLRASRPASDAGYARRAAELELAGRLFAGREQG